MKNKNKQIKQQPSQPVIEWAAHVIAFRAFYGIGDINDVKFLDQSDELKAMKLAINIIVGLRSNSASAIG